ncbi:hypothetical protein H5410_039801 [Solanum commersonii]|uniref:F-box domain-containing protein n=1 Tax=Solanum commersonii TaxID=4109 RepID=A0A9J5XP67_SOLCO|nr:hypothetical protein H5410_039801 [Solanum commersonii]
MTKGMSFLSLHIKIHRCGIWFYDINMIKSCKEGDLTGYLFKLRWKNFWFKTDNCNYIDGAILLKIVCAISYHFLQMPSFSPNPQISSSFLLLQSPMAKEDRLSDLPDSILIHILSMMCENTKDSKKVVRSSVLSKRWQFL